MIIKVMDKNGLFSRGGYNVRFSKKGKTWSSLSYLKKHLDLLSAKKIEKIYSDCKIIIINEKDDFKKEEITFKEFYEKYNIDLQSKIKIKNRENMISRRKFLINEVQDLENRKNAYLKEIERLNKNLENKIKE